MSDLHSKTNDRYIYYLTCIQQAGKKKEDKPLICFETLVFLSIHLVILYVLYGILRQLEGIIFDTIRRMPLFFRNT